MASPRLRLLRNRERPSAFLSAAALSLAFFSSCLAKLSRSASSRRTAFGLNLPVAPPRVALVEAPPLILGAVDDSAASAAAGCSDDDVAVESPSGCGLSVAEAVLRVPRAVALPLTMVLKSNPDGKLGLNAFKLNQWLLGSMRRVVCRCLLKKSQNSSWSFGKFGRWRGRMVGHRPAGPTPLKHMSKVRGCRY